MPQAGPSWHYTSPSIRPPPRCGMSHFVATCHTSKSTPRARRQIARLNAAAATAAEVKREKTRGRMRGFFLRRAGESSEGRQALNRGFVVGRVGEGLSSLAGSPRAAAPNFPVWLRSRKLSTQHFVFDHPDEILIAG